MSNPKGPRSTVTPLNFYSFINTKRNRGSIIQDQDSRTRIQKKNRPNPTSGP